MKKLGIFLVLVLFIKINVNCQSQFTNISSKGNTYGIGKYKKNKDGTSSASLYFDRYQSYQNSKAAVYLEESWTNGNIITKKDKLISNKAFRYDVKNDRIEMRSVIDPKKFKIITIGNQFFIYSKFIKDNYEREGYMLMIVDGYTKLLIRKKMKKISGKGGAYGYSSTQVINSQHYIKVGNNAASFYDKDIDLFSIIPDKHDELSAFIKTNKLKLKKKLDLIELINYYNKIKREEN